MIAQGLGISLVPEMARQAGAANSKGYRLLVDGKPTRTIAAVWHRHRYHSPVAEWFLGSLRKLCAERKVGRARRQK